MTLPNWLIALSIILAIGTPVGWLFYARAEAEHFRELEARNDSLAAVLEARDSLRAELEDSLIASRQRADSLAVIRQQVRTRYVRVEAQRDRTAADIRDYLAGDTVGLRLVDALISVQAEQIALMAEEQRLTELQLAEALAREATQTRIIVQQDSSIVALRTINAELQAEAQRWFRKANPPFTVRLLKDGWKFAAGAGLGYVIAR